LNQYITPILKELPEINVIRNRNKIDYDKRNEELCRRFSVDVVLDFHNSRLRSENSFQDIEMFGYARGKKFEK